MDPSHVELIAAEQKSSVVGNDDAFSRTVPVLFPAQISRFRIPAPLPRQNTRSKNHCFVASSPAYQTPNSTMFESKPRKILNFFQHNHGARYTHNGDRSAIGAERPFLIPSYSLPCLGVAHVRRHASFFAAFRCIDDKSRGTRIMYE